MPYVQVSKDEPDGGVRIRYKIHGHGPRKVVLIAGMCVPATMWIAQVRSLIKGPELQSNHQYSILTLDNRGVGASPVPTSTLSKSTFQGFSTYRMAHDVWEVVDAVGWGDENVALIGHSMGGMIAQRMTVMRPENVRMLGLLATHAGGWWDWLPTWSVMKGVGRLLWNWFDREVNVHVNLDWHFSGRFLEEIVRKDESGNVHVRRRDVYFERYIGTATEDSETENTSVGELVAQETVVEGRVSQGGEVSQGREVQQVREMRSVTSAAEKESSTSFFGHLKAAFGHSLSNEDAAFIKMCKRIRTLVMYGSDDGVIASSSSRALAGFLGADREVEVEGRHFITDESQHEINKILAEELNIAFQNDQDCPCNVCVPEVLESDVDEDDSSG